MLYKVNKQYSRGSATPAAQFNDLNDARLFIQAKLSEDARLKVKVTYQLVEGFDILEEFSEDSSGTGTGAGTQQKVSFQPTPFNTSPRPAGMPANWLKEDDKKDDKK